MPISKKRRESCRYSLAWPPQLHPKRDNGLHAYHILGSILALFPKGHCPVWPPNKTGNAQSSVGQRRESYEQLHETKKLLENKHFRTCWKSYLPIWEIMPLFSWKIQSKALYWGGGVQSSEVTVFRISWQSLWKWNISFIQQKTVVARLEIISNLPGNQNTVFSCGWKVSCFTENAK